MALNSLKVKAIHATCTKHYPLERLETGAAAEKEMCKSVERPRLLQEWKTCELYLTFTLSSMSFLLLYFLIALLL